MVQMMCCIVLNVDLVCEDFCVKERCECVCVCVPVCLANFNSAHGGGVWLN